MIFNSDGSRLLEVTETSDEIRYLWGEDIGSTLELNQQLREHDETKGWTQERKLKHLASFTALSWEIALKQNPEIKLLGKAFDQWLNDSGPNGGAHFRVSPAAAPVKGDSLQLIIK